MTEKTWQDLRDCGLLWQINRQLHLAGFSLVFEVDKDTGDITRVYPATSTHIGFTPEANEEEYAKYLAHMATLNPTEDPPEETPECECAPEPEDGDYHGVQYIASEGAPKAIIVLPYGINTSTDQVESLLAVDGVSEVDSYHFGSADMYVEPHKAACAILAVSKIMGLS